MKPTPNNNPSDPLEVRIAAVPRREIPPEWKTQILSRVQPSGANPRLLEARKRQPAECGWDGLQRVVRGLGLWPALGAVWAAIAAAQLSLPTPRPQHDGGPNPPEERGTPVATETIRQMHQSLAKLMQRDAAPTKPHPTTPPHLLYNRDRARRGTEFLS